jgi:hypothetical protein
VIYLEASSLVVDPILQALQQNYYYPFMMTDMEADTNSEHPEDQSSTTVKAKPTIQKVETSTIETISDVLQEMEGDDPPTESGFVTADLVADQQVSQEKASFFKHRFSI